MELKISVRGNGTGKFLVYTEEQMERLMTEIEVMPEKDWKQQTAVCSIIQGIRPLYLKYKGTGEVDLLQIEMQREL